MKFEKIEIDFASKTFNFRKNAAGIKKNIPFSKKNSKNRKKVITMKLGRGQFELHILISRTNIELTFVSELLIFKTTPKRKKHQIEVQNDASAENLQVVKSTLLR